MSWRRSAGGADERWLVNVIDLIDCLLCVFVAWVVANDIAVDLGWR